MKLNGLLLWKFALRMALFALFPGVDVTHAQVEFDQKERVGSLVVLFLNSHGTVLDPENLSYLSLSFEDVATGKKVDVRHGSGPHLGTWQFTLPYGRYRLQVIGSAGLPVDRIVDVKDAFQITMVAFVPRLRFARSPNVVYGQIPKELIRRGCYWVRLTSLLADGQDFCTRADVDGKFRVVGAETGKFAQVVIGGEGICAISLVELPLIGSDQIVDAERELDFKRQQ